MTRSLPIPLLCLLLLGGCEDYAARTASGGAAPEYDEGTLWDDDDDPASADDDDAGEPEGIEVATVDPLPDSADHHYRDPITVGFDGVARGAALSLHDAQGYAVDADVRWSVSWEQAILTPTVPLIPDSQYEVEIRLGERRVAYRFATSLIGTALEGPEEFDGRTYRFDFSAARFHTPGLLPELLADPQGPSNWLWQVHQVEYATPESGLLYFDFGLGVELDSGFEQNVCAASARFGAPDSNVARSGSYFVTSPADMSVTVGADDFAFEQAWLDGDFAPTGESMENIGFAGWLHAESVDLVLDGEEVCDLLATVGSPCAWCPSGEGQCIYVEFDHVAADWYDGLALAGIDADGVASNEECAGVQAGISCSAGGAARPGAFALLALFVVGLGRRRS